MQGGRSRGALRRAPREHPLPLALALGAALCLAYALTVPRTPDLAAQLFRADLWEQHGWLLWSDSWYSGFLVPGYGLIYPPLGALVGPVAIGIASALTATALFGALALRAYGERAWLGVIWFGLASTVALWGGRTTFALGLAIGLGALLALQRGRRLLAPALGLAAALTSPVAGLFCALAAAAVLCAARLPLWPGRPARGLPAGAALALAVAAAAGTLLLGLAFPTDGYEPFRLAMWLWIPGVCLFTLAFVPPEQAVLRWGALLYLLLGLLLIAVDTPLGDNAVRLGYTFAGPLLAMALLDRHRWLLALVALPLLYWQWTATVNDVVDGLGNETAQRSYFVPALDAIAADRESRGTEGAARVHVPPTRTRWEARYAPESFPLARGWLRQLESDDFADFDRGELDSATYEAWLRAHGVSYVALPEGVELDYMARKEAELLRGDEPLPYLREVYADRSWRVWEVLGPGGRDPADGEPLADRGAVVLSSGADGYSVRVPGPGSYLLRFRYSSYLGVSGGGPACIAEAPEGVAGGAPATLLTVEAGGDPDRFPATVQVEAGLSLGGLLGRDRSCSD